MMTGNGVYKAYKIYILCGNFTFNRGDRANLWSQIGLIRKHYPDCEITVDSLNLKQDAAWYPVHLVSRKGFLFPFRQLRTASKQDAVIWGGGALIADNSCRLITPYWFFILWIIKRILRKKIFGWAHGVVLETKLGNYFAKNILSVVDEMSVRDQGSYHLLHRLDPEKNIQITADTAFLIEPSKRTVGERILSDLNMPVNERSVVGLSFTFWPFYHDSTDWLPLVLSKRQHVLKPRHSKKLDQYKSSIAALVSALIKEMDCQILLIPRYVSSPWQDVEILNDIQRNEVNSKRVFVLSKDYAPVDLFSVWRCLDLHIGSALHDSIVALSCDIPAVHVAYEQKGIDLFNAFNRRSSMVEFEHFLTADGVQDVVNISKSVLSESDQKKNETLHIKHEMKVRAERNMTLFKQFLSGINS